MATRAENIWAKDNPDSKKVLITGGAGFIGSHLVEECQRRGWQIVVVDTVASHLWDWTKRGKTAPIDDSYLVYEGSVQNPEDLRIIFARHRPHYVFHLAAEPYIPKCFDNPRLFMDVNVTGTVNVLEACEQFGVERVLVISSSEVYGCREPGTRLREDSPLNPISTYAVSKLAADRLAITRFHECGVPAIVLRPFNCYGPRATQTYVVPEIVAQAHRGDALQLGNVESVRDFSYVVDTAWAMAEIIVKGQPGETYHYGSGQALSIRQIVEVVAKVIGKKLTIELDRSRLRPADVTWLLADTTKFRETVGAESHLSISFEAGIEATVRWFCANGKRWPYEDRIAALKGREH